MATQPSPEEKLFKVIKEGAPAKKPSPEEKLFKVIKEGGPAAGLDEAMPAQGGAMLTDEEVKNIILYIRADFCKCDYKGK